MTEPLLPAGGCLATPSGPGLGVALDPMAVGRYAIFEGATD